MDVRTALTCLEARWWEYLQERGHYIYRIGYGPDIVRSRNHHKARYRWLLLVGQRPKLLLSEPQRAYIRQHIRQAKKRKEVTYLVVGFMQEPRRIIVLPATTALKARCVRSDKGGIAWNR